MLNQTVPYKILLLHLWNSEMHFSPLQEICSWFNIHFKSLAMIITLIVEQILHTPLHSELDKLINESILLFLFKLKKSINQCRTYRIVFWNI